MVYGKDITAAIIKELKAHDCFVWKHWGGPMSKRGVSDLLGCLPGGRMLAIECKRPGGKPSPEQIRFIKDIQDRGGLGMIADNVEVVKTALRDAGVEPVQGRLFG